MFQYLRIRHRLGCVYHPQSQGILERDNITLKAKLAEICKDGGMNWVEALALALIRMKIQTNSMAHIMLHKMLTD